MMTMRKIAVPALSCVICLLAGALAADTRVLLSRYLAKASDMAGYATYVVSLDTAAGRDVSRFDRAIAAFLPSISDFSFHATGGTIAEGMLGKDCPLPGGLVLPAGARIRVIDGGLLVSGIPSVQTPGAVMGIEPGTFALLIFAFERDHAPDPEKFLARELNVARFQEDVRRANALSLGGRSFNDVLVERLGGPAALPGLAAEALLKSYRRLCESSLIGDFRGLDTVGLPKGILQTLRNIEALHPDFGLGWVEAEKALFQCLYPNSLIKTMLRDPGSFFTFPRAMPDSLVADVSASTLSAAGLVQATLVECRKWFTANPPVTGDPKARRAHSELLDSLGFEIPGDAYFDYCSGKDAAYLEGRYPILAYLRMTEQETLDEVKAERISGGARIWKMYNMGLIVKTPELTFALDYTPLPADAAKAAKALDFAIVSHVHSDHWSSALMDAMWALKKPVYAPFSDYGLTLVDKDTLLKKAGLSISFKLSSQDVPGGSNYAPCLISTIDCGEASGHFTIVHPGDATHAEQFPAATRVDLLILHSDIGLDLGQIVSRAAPGLVNLDHVMELGHNQGQDRAVSYKTAYERLSSLSDLAPTIVLTWGESLYFPPK
jgi:hypothetical protein